MPTHVPPASQQQFGAAAPPPPSGGQYTPPPPPSIGGPTYGGGGPGYGGPGGGPAPANIPNYLVLSIFSTLCCCLPLGIVGIIFAAQVNSKLAVGDVAGAMEASRKAKLFSLIAIGLGLVVSVLWFLLVGTSGFMQAIREAQANR